jgi:hypothetical protein
LYQQQPAAIGYLAGRFGETAMAPIALVDTSESNFERMVRVFGVNLGAVAVSPLAGDLVAAAEDCRGCALLASCANWLSTGSRAASFAPGACPNASLLFRLMLEGLPRPALTQMH